MCSFALAKAPRVKRSFGNRRAVHNRLHIKHEYFYLHKSPTFDWAFESCSIKTLKTIACERPLCVIARGIGMAGVIFWFAFVNVLTKVSISDKSMIAVTSKRPWSVDAMWVVTTIMTPCTALTDNGARSAVTTVSNHTPTSIRSYSVIANGLSMATMSFWLTFVDVWAVFSVSPKASFTLARVWTRCVSTCTVVMTMGIEVALIHIWIGEAKCSFLPSRVDLHKNKSNTFN